MKFQAVKIKSLGLHMIIIFQHPFECQRVDLGPRDGNIPMVILPIKVR